MPDTGINTGMFTAHSFRSASTLKVGQIGVGLNFVACVQIKKSENQTFVKHKGGSHDFREKPRFRLYKNQIAVNS